MKKIFKEGQFTDYAGVERTFTVCAVVSELSDAVVITDYCDFEDEEIVGTVSNILAVGVAVCHPSDNGSEDREIGQKIAEGRAMKPGKEALCMVLGLEKVPTRFIYTQIDYIINDVIFNPGKYIKGYDKMKERYLKRSEQAE